VFISGSFGKLEMGDVDSAAEAIVGNVDCTALTICGAEEIGKIGAGASFDDPVALYTYSTGGLTFAASLADGSSYDFDTDPDGDPITEDAGFTIVNQESFGVGVKFATDMYNVGLAYEKGDDISQLSLGAGTTFSGVSLKAVYVQTDDGDDKVDDYAISAGYTVQAIAFTAFYRDGDSLEDPAYGLGASYDLGGGASVKTGVIDNGDTTKFDVGVNMSF
jgi:outer membrane protein OmpU